VTARSGLRGTARGVVASPGSVSRWSAAPGPAEGVVLTRRLLTSALQDHAGPAGPTTERSGVVPAWTRCADGGGLTAEERAVTRPVASRLIPAGASPA